jgi:hypothetical protein
MLYITIVTQSTNSVFTKATIEMRKRSKKEKKGDVCLAGVLPALIAVMMDEMLQSGEKEGS